MENRNFHGGLVLNFDLEIKARLTRAHRQHLVLGLIKKTISSVLSLLIAKKTGLRLTLRLDFHSRFLRRYERFCWLI